MDEKYPEMQELPEKCYNSYHTLFKSLSNYFSTPYFLKDASGQGKERGESVKEYFTLWGRWDNPF